MWRSRFVRYKTLLSNLGYLSILQGVNLSVPLITLPYLLKVLGPDKYGLVVFAQAIASYLVILVSYGFNITAVREVSLNRDDKKKLSEIVSSVFIIKGSLFILSFLILVLICALFPSLSVHFVLLSLSMWVCLYEFLFPEWYFQGIEKMKFITIITSVFRIIFLVLIFVLIKTESDYVLVPLINGIGSIIASVISLFIVFGSHKLKILMQPWAILSVYLKKSFPVFIYRFSQVYIKLNKVLIGSFVGLTEVAYYDLAEKIVNVLRMPLTIIGQAVFPKNVKDQDKNFIKKMFSFVFGGNILLIVIIWVVAPYLALLLGGDLMKSATGIIRLLSITLIPVTFNSLFASQSLLVFGYNKQYMWAIICAGLVYVVSIGAISVFSWWTIFAIGTAVLLSEFTTSAVSSYYMKKLKII